jgi:hypothetical protein
MFLVFLIELIDQGFRPLMLDGVQPLSILYDLASRLILGCTPAAAQPRFAAVALRQGATSCYERERITSRSPSIFVAISLSPCLFF